MFAAAWAAGNPPSHGGPWLIPLLQPNSRVEGRSSVRGIDRDSTSADCPSTLGFTIQRSTRRRRHFRYVLAWLSQRLHDWPAASRLRCLDPSPLPHCCPSRSTRSADDCSQFLQCGYPRGSSRLDSLKLSRCAQLPLGQRLGKRSCRAFDAPLIS